jgi:hypothetical protein
MEVLARNCIESALRATERKGNVSAGLLELFVDAGERISC